MLKVEIMQKQQFDSLKHEFDRISKQEKDFIDLKSIVAISDRKRNQL